MPSLPRKGTSVIAQGAAKGVVPLRQDPAGRLTRLSRPLEEAILLLMKYVAHTTGREPCQEEMASVLTSYFTLGEITNQISYLRKKPPENAVEAPGVRHASMRINMIKSDPVNCLARAGFFIRAMADAFAAIRRHAQGTLGVTPSDENIALSLRSSFILSELKNQIVHGRNQAHARR